MTRDWGNPSSRAKAIVPISGTSISVNAGKTSFFSNEDSSALVVQQNQLRTDSASGLVETDLSSDSTHNDLTSANVDTNPVSGATFMV